MNFKEEVFCTLQIEATHNWPECPFDEVDFLRVPHRHMFHIKAYKTVTHSDRDVEFIMLKRQIIHWFYSIYYVAKSNIHEFGHKSCEMIAKELITKFDLSCCEVNEDGENGAIVTPIATGDLTGDPSPFSHKPSYFNQELYDQFLETLTSPYGTQPGEEMPPHKPMETLVRLADELFPEKECDICGSTDPDSGCKSC